LQEPSAELSRARVQGVARSTEDTEAASYPIDISADQRGGAAQRRRPARGSPEQRLREHRACDERAGESGVLMAMDWPVP
jgi:hypothetical protein